MSMFEVKISLVTRGSVLQEEAIASSRDEAYEIVHTVAAAAGMRFGITSAIKMAADVFGSAELCAAAAQKNDAMSLVAKSLMSLADVRGGDASIYFDARDSSYTQDPFTHAAILYTALHSADMSLEIERCDF